MKNKKRKRINENDHEGHDTTYPPHFHRGNRTKSRIVLTTVEKGWIIE